MFELAKPTRPQTQRHQVLSAGVRGYGFFGDLASLGRTNLSEEIGGRLRVELLLTAADGPSQPSISRILRQSP
jgi:hypothetical protein